MCERAVSRVLWTSTWLRRQAVLFTLCHAGRQASRARYASQWGRSYGNRSLRTRLFPSGTNLIASHSPPNSTRQTYSSRLPYNRLTCLLMHVCSPWQTSSYAQKNKGLSIQALCLCACVRDKVTKGCYSPCLNRHGTKTHGCRCAYESERT